MPTRPAHLPDFTNFPLNEVVLGIQFAEAKEYHQILAKDVWEIYRSEFPKCEAKQALQPSFETFGPLRPAQTSINLLSGPIHDRYWFLNSAGDQLLQFQADRLLKNWRKIADDSSSYPRFEAMLSSFEKHAKALESYFASLTPQRLAISQCEVTYTNLIFDMNNPDVFPLASDWINIGSAANDEIETFELKNSKQIRQDGRPIARMFVEVGYAIRPTQDQRSQPQRAIQLQLTVRGTPSSPSLDSAIEFFLICREKIVIEFTRITTSKAHKIWGRTK